MTSNFKDHFSEGAHAYAAYRPAYPARLFTRIAAAADRCARAWDCATGSGQAAHGLTEHFHRVIATDASRAQLAHARTHPKISYLAARAEAAPLRARSIDLVVAAQAAHWFDLEAFYREVRRVCVPGAVIAVWCYGLVDADHDIDRVVQTYYADTCGPHWPSERRLVDDGYRSLPFPFARLEVPVFEIEASLQLDQLANYCRTWSASQRLIAERGEEPFEDFLEALGCVWGSAHVARRVRWPLHCLLGRVE